MDKLPETLFLIRAQVFDKLARLLAERLSEIGCVRVVAVVDERSGATDTSPFEKVSLTEDTLASLGLSELPENWGWFCGDICYYIAAARFPGYEYYALIESDVFLPEAGVPAILQALDACGADAIAAQLAPTEQPKKYSRGLAVLGLNPAWGCIFPLTRVSASMLREMQSLRQEALTRAPDEKLNDEGVLAGAVQRGGFSYANLEDIAPSHVNRETFDTNPPHLFEAIVEILDEQRLFHPVVPFETVLSRIETGENNYTRHRMRKVLRAAPKSMKLNIKQALDAYEA